MQYFVNTRAVNSSDFAPVNHASCDLNARVAYTQDQLGCIKDTLKNLQQILSSFPDSFALRSKAIFFSRAPSTLTHLALRSLIANFIKSNAALKGDLSIFPAELSERFVAIILRINPGNTDAVLEMIRDKNLTLESLDLSDSSVSDKGLEALARWPKLSHLKSLNLGDCHRLSPRGLEYLRGASRLEALSLDGCSRELLSSLDHHSLNLKQLSLARMNLQIEDLKCLQNFQLLELNLSSNILLGLIDTQSFACRFPSIQCLRFKFNIQCNLNAIKEFFPNLQILDAEDCLMLGSLEVSKLIRSMHGSAEFAWYKDTTQLGSLTQLTSLKISRTNDIVGSFFSFIASHCTNLTTLKLQGAGSATDEDIFKLEKLKKLKKLACGSLNQVTIRGLRSMHANKNLTSLSLDSTLITDETVAKKIFPEGLTHLELKNTFLSFRGLEKLLQNLPSLESLVLVNNVNFKLEHFRWPKSDSLKRIVFLGLQAYTNPEALHMPLLDVDMLYFPNVSHLYDLLSKATWYADYINRERLLIVSPTSPTSESLNIFKAWLKILKGKKQKADISDQGKVISALSYLRQGQRKEFLKGVESVFVHTQHLLGHLDSFYHLLRDYNIQTAQDTDVWKVFGSPSNVGVKIKAAKQVVKGMAHLVENNAEAPLKGLEEVKERIDPLIEDLQFFTEPKAALHDTIRISAQFEALIKTLQITYPWIKDLRLQFFYDSSNKLSIGLKMDALCPISDQTFQQFMNAVAAYLSQNQKAAVRIEETLLPLVAFNFSNFTGVTIESLKAVTRLNQTYPSVFKIQILILQGASHVLKTPNLFGRQKRVKPNSQLPPTSHGDNDPLWYCDHKGNAKYYFNKQDPGNFSDTLKSILAAFSSNGQSSQPLHLDLSSLSEIYQKDFELISELSRKIDLIKIKDNLNIKLR